jgi:hypothetical protein
MIWAVGIVMAMQAANRSVSEGNDVAIGQRPMLRYALSRTVGRDMTAPP